MSKSELVKAVTEPANKALTPLASSVGHTLQDIWDLVFGGFGTYVDKKRAARLKDLEDFRESLTAKVSAIPEDSLCEPKLSVIGPALEASKFFFEEPQIREMFARLIASSMNKELSSTVHPSFSAIIQQMSPLDAENLALFDRYTSFPVVEYQRKTRSEVGYITLFRNIFVSNPNRTDLLSQSQSISSLEHLGLLQADYEHYLVDAQRYGEFDRTSLYTALQNALGPEYELSIQNGLVTLTPLGQQFRSICLD